MQANCQRTLIKCREGGEGGGGRRESCIQRAEIPLVASCNKNGIGSLRVDYVVFTYDGTVEKVLNFSQRYMQTLINWLNLLLSSPSASAMTSYVLWTKRGVSVSMLGRRDSVTAATTRHTHRVGRYITLAN